MGVGGKRDNFCFFFGLYKIISLVWYFGKIFGIIVLLFISGRDGCLVIKKYIWYNIVL